MNKGGESQKRQLEEALLSSGWRIAEREPITAEWWVDEIWTIESVWRPVGFTLFLSFLVDLVYSGTRRSGEKISAITCSSIRPRTRADMMGGPLIFLRPAWEKNLPEFLAKLKELRDQATQQ